MFHIGRLKTNIYQLPVNTSHCVGQQTVTRATERKSSGHFVRPLSRGAREGFREKKLFEFGVEGPIEVTHHCINIHALGLP